MPKVFVDTVGINNDKAEAKNITACIQWFPARMNPWIVYQREISFAPMLWLIISAYLCMYKNWFETLKNHSFAFHQI